MFRYKDQLGNTISLKGRPQRVVSLVPSQSELLWDLGLCDKIAGITKFCIHPNEMFRTIEKVGGTKQLNLEKIRKLKPDLIIGNKEENDQAQILELRKEFNVWMSDIYNFDDAFHMISSMGEIFDQKKQADRLNLQLSVSLQKIKGIFKGYTAAYFIWNNPYMVAANHTFINQVLVHLGIENVFSQLQRYPEISIETLQQTKPLLCFLSSEPFPFKAKHIKVMQQLLPESKILIVDGELFSWYGSRMLQLEKYVRELQLS